VGMLTGRLGDRPVNECVDNGVEVAGRREKPV
jgi:hypothetical protein